MKLQIADKIIEVKNLYSYAEEYCQEFLAPAGAPVDLSYEITESDVTFEQEKSLQEDLAMGIAPKTFSPAYLETLAIYRKIAEDMPRFDTFLFHGSALAMDGKAFVFTAKSGTGKSTHARLWRDEFGDQVIMINDDKPLIRMSLEGPVIYGTPWRGKHGLGSNVSFPLKAICILERGAENKIVPISFMESYPLLLQQSYRPFDMESMQQTLHLLSRLKDTVKYYKLSCNMNPDAAIISHAALSKL